MKYTTDIPKARQLLKRIADRIETEGFDAEAREIRRIIEDFMTRRPGPRRAPSTRNVVTKSIKAKVIQDLIHTDLPQEDIARKYNIDGGRVSEIYRTIRN